MQHVGAGLVQKLAIDLVANVDGIGEEVFGAEADAAFLLRKVALHAQAVNTKTTLVTLQLHLLTAVEREGLQAPQLGELVVTKHAAAGHEAFVAGFVERVLIVQHGIIRVETTIQAEFAAVDACKYAAAVSVFLADVGVGNTLDTSGDFVGIEQGRPYRLNGARGVAREHREIQVYLLNQRTVAQFVVVRVFGPERGLARGNDKGVGLLLVGVEELQRRALNAAVIGQLQHVTVGQLAREVYTGHQHPIVGNGNGGIRIGEISRDGRVFVAQTRFEGEAFGQAQGVGHIGSSHVLTIIEAIVQAHGS